MNEGLIQTVNGPIQPNELGVTLMHEHLVSTLKRDKQLNLDPIIQYKKHNGKTIVDVTPAGCHLQRAVDDLRDISVRTGIHIIASTGFYKEPYLPQQISQMSEEEIADIYVQEIEEGIEGTGIKAGVIGEVGSSYNQITDLEARILRAAGLAQRRTGIAVITHTTHGTMGLAQLQLLEQAGAELNRVVIGHCDLNPDLDYHLEVARRGAYLGYDTIGKERWLSAVPGEELAHRSDKERIYLILKVLDAGLSERIILSSDILWQEINLNKKTLGRYMYTYVIFKFLGSLKDVGVDDKTLQLILEINPRRVLSGR